MSGRSSLVSGPPWARVLAPWVPLMTHPSPVLRSGVGAAVASGAGELAGVAVSASVGAGVAVSGIGESAGNGVVAALRSGVDVAVDHGVAVSSGGLNKSPSGTDVRAQRPVLFREGSLRPAPFAHCEDAVFV